MAQIYQPAKCLKPVMSPIRHFTLVQVFKHEWRRFVTTYRVKKIWFKCGQQWNKKFQKFTSKFCNWYKNFTFLCRHCPQFVSRGIGINVRNFEHSYSISISCFALNSIINLTCGHWLQCTLKTTMTENCKQMFRKKTFKKMSFYITLVTKKRQTLKIKVTKPY